MSGGSRDGRDRAADLEDDEARALINEDQATIQNRLQRLDLDPLRRPPPDPPVKKKAKNPAKKKVVHRVGPMGRDG